VTAPGDEPELVAEHTRRLQENLSKLVRGFTHGNKRISELTPRGLLALLCGSTFSPLVAAAFAAGVPGAEFIAVTGAAGSVGSGVLSVVLMNALNRLRDRGQETPLSEPEIEAQVTKLFEEALAGEAETKALEHQIAEAFKSIDAGEVILRASTPAVFTELVNALGRFGENFLDVRDVLLDGMDRVFSQVSEIQRGQVRLSQDISDLAAESARFYELFALDPGDPDLHPAGTRIRRWQRTCPYLGLRSFGEVDAPIFHGRERLTAELAVRLADHQSTGIIMVTGPSGAGKTSLLQAGLLPVLRRGALVPGSDRWPCLVLEPAEDPLGQLARDFATLGDLSWRRIREELAERPDEANIVAQQAVDRYLLHRGSVAGGRMVLLVDQFEDAFVSGASPGNVEGFITALKSAATMPAERGREPPAVIVIAVRADFLNRCVESEALRAATERLFIVPPMEELEFRRAVTGPAIDAGLSFEDGLVDLVLGDVRAARPDGVLPLLSEAMRLTWEYRSGHQLTGRGYERGGGVSGAVQRSAEAIYASLEAPQQALARDILLSMTATTEDGQPTRQVKREDVAAGHPADEVNAALGALADGRLIVLDETRVQIVHDALLSAWPRLRDWLIEDRLNFNLHRQLEADAVRWRDHGNDSSYLYRGIELASLRTAISEWPTDRHQLTPRERKFLRASERAAARASHRRQLIAGALVVLLVASVTGGLLARKSAANAEAQRTLAYSGQAAALSEEQDSQNPVTAAGLAAAAYDEAPSTAARESMLQVLAQPVHAVLTAGGPIKAVAFSDDHGGLLATGGKAVMLYRLTTNRPIGSPIVVAGGANGLAFNAAGTVLATADGDGTARLWDVATGREIGSPMPASSSNGVNAVAFGLHGTILATADGDGTARLWDVATHREIGPALVDGGHVVTNSQVTDVAFSPGGKVLATSSLDGTVRLWDVATGRQFGQSMSDVGAHLASTHEMFAVTFNPAGTTLATADQDGEVSLWDVATQRLRGPPLLVAGADDVAFSPDGKILAVAENGGVAALWVVATRTLITPVLADTTAGPTAAVAFGPGAAVLATVSGNGVARLWDLTNFRNVTPVTPVGASHGIAFGRDGRTIAVIGTDLAVRVWNLSTSRQIGKPIPASESGEASAVALSPDGRLLATGGFDGNVRLWTVGTGRLAAKPIGASTTAAVSAVAFSPDGTLLATGDASGIVRLWNPRTGQPGMSLTPDGSAGVGSLVFSPNGTMLAVVDGAGRLRLWNVVTRQAVSLPIAVSVDGVAFSPVSPLIATADEDGDAQLWNLTTGLQDGAPMLATDSGSATDVAFSPDGSLLATAGGDGDAGVWDVSTQHQIGPVLDASSGASGLDAVAFSPVGSTLATVGADGTAVLWGIEFPRDLFSAVCAIAGGSLTRQEWSTYIQSAPYIKGCP
jgi:WD40 repeat protein